MIEIESSSDDYQSIAGTNPTTPNQDNETESMENDLTEKAIHVPHLPSDDCDDDTGEDDVGATDKEFTTRAKYDTSTHQEEAAAKGYNIVHFN